MACPTRDNPLVPMAADVTGKKLRHQKGLCFSLKTPDLKRKQSLSKSKALPTETTPRIYTSSWSASRHLDVLPSSTSPGCPLLRDNLARAAACCHLPEPAQPSDTTVAGLPLVTVVVFPGGHGSRMAHSQHQVVTSLRIAVLGLHPDPCYVTTRAAC